jgi:hypothetical protein
MRGDFLRKKAAKAAARRKRRRRSYGQCDAKNRNGPH